MNLRIERYFDEGRGWHMTTARFNARSQAHARDAIEEIEVALPYGQRLHRTFTTGKDSGGRKVDVTVAIRRTDLSAHQVGFATFHRAMAAACREEPQPSSPPDTPHSEA